MVILTNAVDTFVNGNPAGTAQQKNYGTTERLRTKAVGWNQYAFIHFGRPGIPRGATVISAKLRIRNDGVATGAVTVTVRRVAAKWSVNRINFNNMPGVTGSSATLAKTDAPNNAEWVIDVTTLMQEVANGAQWYGFRFISNTDTLKWFSAQATNARRRPTLEIVWSTAPTAPTMLSPAGGRAVPSQFPDLTFDYTDPQGRNMIAAQIQIAATEAELGTATDYDTGVLPLTTPTFVTNSSSTGYVVPPGGAWTGIPAAAVRWWRVRVQREDGQWSEYSVATSFTRVAKPTVTITNPAASPDNFVWEPTPPFSWTVSGGTQKHYQVLVTDSNDTTKEFWNSGKITSSATTVTPPVDALKDTSELYRLIIRVWDDVQREQSGSTTIYTEIARNFTYNHDNTVTGVSNYTVTANLNGLPITRLNWTRATAPDSFVIRRDGIVIGEYIPADLLVSGTSYRFDDVGAGPRDSHTWEVLAIVNSRESSPATVTSSVSVNAPLLMRMDGSDPIMFANPKRDRQFHDRQELHEVMADYVPPVLITQSLGGLSGHLEGLLTSQMLINVTGKQMRDRLKGMRNDRGVPLMLFLGDEAHRVTIFNVQWDYDSAPSEVSYYAEFDWVVV